jgi:hypothetical protein
MDEAKNHALLRRSVEALPSGGAVVISELCESAPKLAPIGRGNKCIILHEDLQR